MTTIPLSALTATWNAGATTFTGIGLSVTDTASAAGSLLMDLQVGGVSRFSVRKDGAVTMPAVFFQIGNDIGLNYNAAGAITLNPAGSYNWGSASLNSPDLFLFRDAANTLAQRNGTNAQAFRIYGTYTDASNWERLSVGYAAESLGNQFVVAHAKAGSGTNRNLWIGTLGSTSTIIGTNGTGRWTFNENGHFVANADNAYDIGASGANRPRNVYVAGQVIAGTSLECGSGDGFVITSRAIIRSFANGTIQLSNAASNDFNRLQFGGTTSSFPALKRSSTSLQVRLADDSADAPFTSGCATIDTLTIGLGGQTSVSSNTALGNAALNSASLTGGQNTGVGKSALRDATTADSNTAVGLIALERATTAFGNSALGVAALRYFNTANNVAVGYEAARGSTTVANNTGNNLTAVGYQALLSNTSGGSNVAVGTNALQINTAGGSLVAVGLNALQSNTTGSNSVAVGLSALVSNLTGSNNIGIGYQAGDAITTGSTNIVIGHDIDVDSATGSNQINIGDRYYHNRMRLVETTDPAAPAADNAIIFVRDNGSGKTQLCVRFPTGAVQVISTEP
jgi:hypothetical protein